MHLSRQEAGELWEAMEGHKPLIIGDVLGDSWLAQAFRQAFGEYLDQEMGYVRTWVGVPLKVRERHIGWLSVHHCEPGAYVQHHVSLAQAIANQAAIAIENARLYGQAQRLAALEERQKLARDLARLGVTGAVRRRPGGAHRQRVVGSRCPRTRVESHSG